MRARDRDDFPTACVSGLYGCGKCGTYHRMSVGEKLACHFCRFTRPLILVSECEQKADSNHRHERQKDE